MIRKNALKWMTWLLLGIALVSGLMIGSYLRAMARDADGFDELSRVLDQPGAPSLNQGEEPLSSDSDKMVFSGLKQLYEKNQDIAGWLFVSGTEINYPVMYTPADPEYYLHRNFDKLDSRSGVPFIDGRCTPGSSHNLIIYGHHMKNGSMFSDLILYSEKSFWEANPTFTYYTAEEKQVYEIIAAFPADVSKDETLQCYEFIDGASPEEYDRYWAAIKKSALYETGADVNYGDRLMTLSTCSYHVEDGRFVIIGKLME